MKQDFKLKIYSSDQEVFTLDDLALLLQEPNRDNLKSKVNYYVKNGVLDSPRRGIYTKPDYSKEELAVKIYTPSYISFETVLAQAGVIFQYYKTIFAASYLSRKIKVEGQNIHYRKIKDEILTNNKGVKLEPFAKATPERAFLDSLYVYKNYYFDNLSTLDFDKVQKLLPIYDNKQLTKKVNKLKEDFYA